MVNGGKIGQREHSSGKFLAEFFHINGLVRMGKLEEQAFIPPKEEEEEEEQKQSDGEEEDR